MDQEMLANAGEYVLHHGAIHDDDCPGDDTCSCSCKPMNDGIESVLRLAKEAQHQIATLTAERTALHEMFQRAATADRRTPMTKEDAALLTIGNDTYIVPKAIAARVAELEGVRSAAEELIYALDTWREGGMLGEGVKVREERLRSAVQKAALLTPAPPAAKAETRCKFCGSTSCYCCPECGENVAIGHKPDCSSDPSKPETTETPAPTCGLCGGTGLVTYPNASTKFPCNACRPMTGPDCAAAEGGVA